MSTTTGPNEITNGLVFYYDMDNTQKSWIGPPTTNLSDVGLQGVTVGLTYIGLDNGWKKYALSDTFSYGTYPYAIAITNYNFVGGTTYSSACYIKTNVPNKFNYFGASGISYVNQPLNLYGTLVSIEQPDGSFYVAREGFQYTSTTSEAGYLFTNPINGTTFDPSTDFVWIKEGQIEVGDFSTPYTSGTRTNTQALLDLTGKNSITTNSLTYNSDGSFSFDGTSNSLTVPFNSSVFTFDNLLSVSCPSFSCSRSFLYSGVLVGVEILSTYSSSSKNSS
jgi:hypothetical protein